MKTLYFVRHGESEANASGVTAGGGMDVGLTEHGKKQAQQLGQELKNKKIDLIVSSPMKRAFNTATIIASAIGYNQEDILTNQLFSERHLGELTGAERDKVRTYYDIGALPSSAETTEALHERVAQGLQWLKTLDGQNIVLVSHGGPGRMIRTIYRNEKHSSINTLSRIGNAQVLQLSL